MDWISSCLIGTWNSPFLMRFKVRFFAVFLVVFWSFFGHFLNILKTYDKNSRFRQIAWILNCLFRGYLGPPLPTLKRDVINERSLMRFKVRFLAVFFAFFGHFLKIFRNLLKTYDNAIWRNLLILATFWQLWECLFCCF